MVVDGNVGVTDDDMKVAKPFVWTGRSFVVSGYSYPYDSYDQRGVPAWGIYSWFPKTKRVIGDAELGFRAKFDFQWSLLPGNSLFVSFRRVKRKHALGCGWCHMASDDINAHIVLNPATKSPKVFPEWYIYIWRFLHHFHCFHSYVQLFDILFIYRLLHLQEVYYNMGKHLLLRCHATWLDWVTLLPQVFERHLYFQRPLTSREATRMTILYLYSLSLGLSTVLSLQAAWWSHVQS